MRLEAPESQVKDTATQFTKLNKAAI